MRRNRPIFELIGLAILLVVAVHLWNGPAQFRPFTPCGSDSLPLSDASGPIARVDTIADNSTGSAIPRAPDVVIPTRTMTRAEGTHSFNGSSSSIARASDPGVMRTRRFTTVRNSAEIDEGRLASAIHTRFWDGVVEFGCPRRTIELVDNEVERMELHRDEGAWPRAKSLLDELDSLESPVATAWGEAIRLRLLELSTIDRLDRPSSLELLGELEHWTTQTEVIVGQLTSLEEQYRVRHATYALQRRLELWRAVVDAAQPHVSAEVMQCRDAWDAEAMAAQIDLIQQWLPSIPNGDDWMTFLAVDHFASGLMVPASQRHVEIARTTCHQIEIAKMTAAQRAFLETPVLAAYRESLRTLAMTPVDFQQFLQSLEDFEAGRCATGAAPLIQSWNEIRRTPVPAYQQVAQILNLHYRNANIRVSMTEEFANRFLPAAQRARAPVREQLLGADVQGLSDTLTHFQIRFVPDPNEIRVKLEATGHMASQTQAIKGPVTLFNTNQSKYMLQKLLTLNPQGLRVGRSRAEATADTNLRGVQSRYDGMPLVGNMVRRIARQKHHDSKPVTRRALSDLFALRIQQRMDAEFEKQMQQARQRLEKGIIQPLEDMNLAPEALAMQTTSDRMVVRGRLAGDAQLAAYTARPQAMADNLLSVQLHESALNNFLDQMDLGGRYVEVRTLIQDVLDQWGLKDAAIPEDIPDGVKLELAADHPIVVRCDDDRIRVEIAVKKLCDEYSRRTWQNFKVRVYFVPETNGFSCELQRDGIVELQSLESRRLSNRDQFALRAIFGRVFSKNHPLQIVTPDLNEDPRLRELNVDQFVIRDGWIGISVGEMSSTHVARQSRPSDSSLR